ncbi:3'3'-cGAMP-specific phosphodiesterase [Nocardioides maradonensis]
MSGVRLAELLASLSLATDLGLGLPQEHVLRQTLLADRIAELSGWDDLRRCSVVHVSLMAWVGCVADSHELAQWFDDDLALRAASYDIDKVGLPMMRFMVGQLAERDGAFGRVGAVAGFLTRGARQVSGGFLTHCQTTGDIAERLGVDPAVRRALGQAFERWDGHGYPSRLAGDAIEPLMRVVHVADDLEVFHRRRGAGAALEVLRARRGTEFDPTVVDLVLARSDEVFAAVEVVDPWAEVLSRCTRLDRIVPDVELDQLLGIVADYADLKSPWWTGHSRAVADRAALAAGTLGLDAAAVTTVRRAGLVHRLGAVGVSSGTWARAGALSAAEAERVRSVPYLTGRVLARQPVLAAIGRLAGQVRERLDGSGYPNGLVARDLSTEARVLAAAQRYQALGEERPHRPAVEDRAAVLRADVRAGRLDGDAVAAVLAGPGRAPRRRTSVAGLTARELEVLTLLARGRSNKEIAAELGISARTVGTHVEHVYAKAGVSTRGAVTMFAMRHGLVG